MFKNRTGTWLFAGQAAAFAVLGGIIIAILPFLQHWIFYVLWGPGLAIGQVWIHRGVTVHSESGVPFDRPDIINGLIVGITHLVAVTVVWYAVTQGVVLKVHDTIGP